MGGTVLDKADWDYDLSIIERKRVLKKREERERERVLD